MSKLKYDFISGKEKGRSFFVRFTDVNDAKVLKSAVEAFQQRGTNIELEEDGMTFEVIAIQNFETEYAGFSAWELLMHNYHSRSFNEKIDENGNRYQPIRFSDQPFKD